MRVPRENTDSTTSDEGDENSETGTYEDDEGLTSSAEDAIISGSPAFQEFLRNYFTNP